LQLTGGQFKGMKLATPKTNMDVRPTLSKVRESVFNILASYFGEVSGLKFLDCFSGSGIIALEAYSRGFEVVAIEKDHTNVRIIKENFAKLGGGKVICADMMKFKTDEKFDVVYLDPPWDIDYEDAIEKAKTLGDLIVCEHENDIPDCGLKIIKEKKYGRARLTVLSSNF